MPPGFGRLSVLARAGNPAEGARVPSAEGFGAAVRRSAIAFRAISLACGALVKRFEFDACLERGSPTCIGSSWGG